MTKKKLFSDPRWNDTSLPIVIGHSKPSKESRIVALRHQFKIGFIDKEKYLKKLVEIEEDYVKE